MTRVIHDPSPHGFKARPAKAAGCPISYLSQVLSKSRVDRAVYPGGESQYSG